MQSAICCCKIFKKKKRVKKLLQKTKQKNMKQKRVTVRSGFWKSFVRLCIHFGHKVLLILAYENVLTFNIA